MPKKKAMPAPASRTPTAQETALETQAILQLRSIGNGLGYQRLSARVVTAFRQYRYVVTNMQRRNRVYRALSGLLTYGLRRAPPGTYYLYSSELLNIVRDCYPSGEDVAWLLNNSNNQPTLDVEVSDLFDDKP
ncbi:uncharacterized protein LOC118424298 [Branchiostoma floridae]|uniref:Uncharacterized protein LOC118424297 n=1 Tax=Branchiostoma floridae TaxID=7739 RepID=A0A9J7LV52_BRAFL|nr:uncharacterized protein LOC118424297 [Branchiostoma floridae]XP_035688739.1 uncharacterized protein LOC118424298 [Branchiostoma floridae]